MALLAAGAVALGACSGDLASATGEQGTEGADDGGGNGDDDGGSGLGESGGADAADETGADEDSGPSGSDGDDDGPGLDACNFDCGAGICEIDALGQARCECDLGAVPYGLSCFVCDAATSPYDIEIPRALVSVEVRINGVAAPDDEYETGLLSLRDPVSGDSIILGQTREQKLTAIVAPGSYELHYARILGGNVVPRNRGARIDSLEIAGDMDVLVDIPVVTLAGDFLIDGNPVVDEEYEYGEMWLVDPASGDEVILGRTSDGSYSVRVTPGDYEVHYRRELGGQLVPLNGDAVVGSLFLGAELADSATEADLDVPMIEIAGAITLAGATPPDDEYETASLAFRDPATGDEFPIGETRDGLFSARVVPGQYEVVYDRLLGGTVVPVNNRAILGVVDARVSAVDIDVPAVSVSGTFAIDGATPDTDPSNDAIITLRDTQTGDEIALGHLTEGSYSRIVIPQEYAVDYGVLSNVGGLPANTQATLMTMAIDADTTLPIDIVAASVAGAFTVEGGAPPTSEYDDARIFLRSSAGDSVLLGNTRLGAYDVSVLAGSYDVVYVIEAGGAEVPANGEATLQSGVVVAGDTSLNVDVPSFALGGSITVGKAAPPGGTSDRGALVAENLQTGDVVALGGTETGSYLRTLTRGRYILAYRSEAPGDTLPHNSNLALGCITIE